MKKTILYIVISILFLNCINAQVNTSNSDSGKSSDFDIEKIIIGDINNDKIIDTAFVKGPKLITDKDGFEDYKSGTENITISFSCDFPEITLDNAVSGFVENIGDIDNDGKSEIIVVPFWFIGCRGRIHFFTMKNGKWKNVGNVERHICRDGSGFLDIIKKRKDNKIKVMGEVFKDGDYVEKAKIISIK